jgi:hypothetical protein
MQVTARSKSYVNFVPSQQSEVAINDALYDRVEGTGKFLLPQDDSASNYAMG